MSASSTGFSSAKREGASNEREAPAGDDGQEKNSKLSFSSPSHLSTRILYSIILAALSVLASDWDEAAAV